MGREGGGWEREREREREIEWKRERTVVVVGAVRGRSSHSCKNNYQRRAGRSE
jgi:hypothetical protein